MMNRNQNHAYRTCFFISVVLLLFLFGHPQACAQTAETYKEAIQKGNSELKNHKLLDAKAYFEMALRLKPGDKTAQQLIDQTVKLIKNQDSRKAGYYNLTDEADDYLAKGDLDLAKLTYQKALKIVPGDAYAEKKIREIIQEQNQEKQKDSTFRAKIEKGTHLIDIKQFDKAISLFKEAQKIFPKKKITAAKIALAIRLKAEYQHRYALAAKEIKTAQRYLLIKNYSEALIHFNKADSLTPGSKELLAKINQIRPLINKQKAYDSKTNEADSLYIAKNFPAAKAKYEQAKALWPSKSYPEDMIKRINSILKVQAVNLNRNYLISIHQGDSLLKISQFEKAKENYEIALKLKPQKTYPRQQLKILAIRQKKELAILAARYRVLLQEADSLYERKQLTASKKLFREAVALEPDKPYPMEKIKEITIALLKQAAREKAEKQYKAFVASGNQFFNAHNWELSLQKFQMASQLKPDENYPRIKIASIQKILADSARQRKINKQFAQQLEMGNKLKAAKQWINAKRAFERAKELKPSNGYIRKAIASIDSILQQVGNRNKVDLAYNKSLKLGDSLLAIKSYRPALKAFKDANMLKPDEATPKQKIESINQILLSIAHQKQLDAKYSKAIRKADSLLSKKEYEPALTNYQAALNLKENENYPREKIKEISGILKQQAKEKKEQLYQKTLASADTLFQSKNYEAALLAYKRALSIYPGNSYPQHQINQCQQLMAVTQSRLQMRYDQEIATADRYYHDKVFNQAIDTYREAHHLMSDEKYPMEMIHKIIQYLSQHAVEDVVTHRETIPSNTTMKFSFKPIPVKVRVSNYVLIKATNITGTAFNIIFTFGEGTSKNGGYVVQVPKVKGSYSFIVRIGNRYQWFSADNDWFSIFPENNPIEISLIRISKSD